MNRLTKFYKKREKYLFVSQVVLYFLAGIVILRDIYFGTNIIDINFKENSLVLIVLICFLFIVKVINKHNYYLIDVFLNIIFLVIISITIIKGKDNFLKILFILPPIIISYKYGLKKAFAIILLSCLSAFFVSFFSNFINIDSDIILICLVLLLTWLLGSMTDTEAQIRKELERMATHDGITEIYNYRSFNSILDQELEKARKEKTILSLMLIDIDYFKLYNDSMGHLKGEVVLKKIAQILHKTIDKAGFCARYGGEEFSVLLPGKKIDEAKKIAEEIKNKIEKEHYPGVDVLPQGKMSVSIGISEFPTIANSKENLIQKTDEALYKAKFFSKNKVETYYSVFDELGQNLHEEEKELFNTVRTLTMVINAKDRYTYGHSERTMNYAKKLAEKIGLEKQKVKNIIYGALLHDIGKIEIPREILNKPEKLNDEEWQMLKQHPLWGADIIRALPSFKGSVDIIMYHHENFDGTGYYQILKGENIPIGARILRIVDSFDAITTKRPYKQPMNFEQALEEMERFAGTHYDPVLFEKFKKMIRYNQKLDDSCI